MKHTERIIALTLAAVLALPAMTFAVTAEEDGTEPVILPAEYVDIHTEEQARYLADTMPSYEDYVHGTKDISQPAPVICDIAGDGFPVQSKYWFQKSDNPQFENCETKNVTGVKNGKYNLYNVKLGEHFYWRASTELETIEQSPIHEIYITTTRWRNIFVYGIVNMRDIGGWPSSLGEGAYIRQGLYYRGGNPEGILKKGIEQIAELGLGTEIDLRHDSDITNPGPYLEGVDYYNIQLPSYGHQDVGFLGNFDAEFTQIFGLIAEAAEKPVYLHCWAGADRTGLISFMLLTLCGVSVEDAARDYLLTNYANFGGRSINAPYSWYQQLEQFGGETKAEQAANWLLSVGVTEETIEKIRTTFVENYDPEYKGSSLAPSSWAAEEVAECVELGLVPEELQESYDLPITRGQVSKMIMNLLEACTWKTSEALVRDAGAEINTEAFTDTKYNAVLAANALGIIKGVGKDRFNVNGLLTRAQMAALINRAANAVGVDTTGFTHDFTDITGSSAWAYDELGWPVHMGIIKGVGGTRFAPGSNLTREQAILIIYRAYDVLKTDKTRLSNTGLTTPAHEDGGTTLTDYIYYDDITAYMMLDESAEHDMGGDAVKAVLKGNAKASAGYYSEGVNVSGGYITLEGFHPETESFSVAMMVKIHGKEKDDPSLIGNKDWTSGNNAGFVLSFRENDLKFNLGNGKDRMDEEWYLPVDYATGWMHVILVVDRENGTVGVSIDFSQLDSREIAEILRDATFAGIGDVNVGQDGTGTYSYGFDGEVDDIIIFEKALTDDDIAKLAAYYGVITK